MWLMILITESLMLVIDLANEMELLSSSSDIDGLNSNVQCQIKRDLS